MYVYIAFINKINIEKTGRFYDIGVTVHEARYIQSE